MSSYRIESFSASFLFQAIMGLVIMLTTIFPVEADLIKVTKAAEIIPLLAELPAKKVILLDVDDTLITPVSKTFRKAPYNQLIDDIKKNKSQYSNYEEIISNWRLQRKVMLIDEEWPKIIKIMQQTTPVYALTKMDVGRVGNIASMKEWRYLELQKLGINFSPNPRLLPPPQETGAFYQGIFITGPVSKSATIEPYLGQLDLEAIVLVDDRIEHLEDMAKFCEEHSLIFRGILFDGLKILTGNPDPAIVKLQKEHLIDHAEWLEDEAAAKLVK